MQRGSRFQLVATTSVVTADPGQSRLMPVENDHGDDDERR